MNAMTLRGRWELYRSIRRKSPNTSRRDVWRFTGGMWP